jgi:hypothetical protein
MPAIGTAPLNPASSRLEAVEAVEAVEIADVPSEQRSVMGELSERRP